MFVHGLPLDQGAIQISGCFFVVFFSLGLFSPFFGSHYVHISALTISTLVSNTEDMKLASLCKRRVGYHLFGWYLIPFCCCLGFPHGRRCSCSSFSCLSISFLYYTIQLRTFLFSILLFLIICCFVYIVFLWCCGFIVLATSFSSALTTSLNVPKIVSENDQEIPQSKTADNPMALRGSKVC